MSAGSSKEYTYFIYREDIANKITLNEPKDLLEKIKVGIAILRGFALKKNKCDAKTVVYYIDYGCSKIVGIYVKADSSGVLKLPQQQQQQTQQQQGQQQPQQPKGQPVKVAVVVEDIATLEEKVAMTVLELDDKYDDLEKVLNPFPNIDYCDPNATVNKLESIFKALFPKLDEKDWLYNLIVNLANRYRISKVKINNQEIEISNIDLKNITIKKLEDILKELIKEILDNVSDAYIK